MIIKSFTDKGKRNINEDFVFSKRINDDSLFCAIADGMGGYEKGEIAAELVVRSIYYYLKEHNGQLSKNVITNSIFGANEALKDYSIENNIKLGTTIGGVVIYSNHAIIFWVGDVRILFFRNNNLIFESQDHSLLNELKKDKSLPEDWDVNRIKHVVTRSVSGNGQDFNPDFFEIDLELKDVVLICSDGFLESSDSNFIKKIAEESVLDENDVNNRCINSSDNASIIKIQL
jgi:protein phosphatase